MKKILLFLTTILSSVLTYGQFATGGTGLYQRQIYWLPWYKTEDNGKTGLVEMKINNNNPVTHTSFPSSILPTLPTTLNAAGTDVYEYTWKINDYMRVKGRLYNVTRVADRSSSQKAAFATEKYNSYDSSGLQRMYTGLKDKQIGIGVKDGTLKFDIDLVFEMIKPGTTTWAPIDNPQDHGLVFADSESIDGNGEYMSAMVDQSTSWYLIDYAKTPAPSTPGGNFNGTAYQICYSTASNLKKVTINNPNTGNRQQGATAVMFAKGVNTIKNLELKGSGYTYVSIGYFINHDPSNDRGYDNAMHFQEMFTTGNSGGDFKNVTGCINYNNITNNEVSIPGAKLTTNAFFGNAPNVEEPYNDSLSNLDALTQATLIKENDGTATLRYNVKYTNNYNTPAYIYAFVDTNRNGVFESKESAYHLIAKNTISRAEEYDTLYYYKVAPNVVDQNLVLEWPGFKVSSAGTYSIRFRITTDSLINDGSTTIDERAYGLARNGEVTDRNITVLTEAEYNQALPVKLVDFKAYNTANGVNVKWITNDESMINVYHVEKSMNGSDWKVIATVKANNESVNTYEILDAQQSGNAFYRLAIIENESKNYSKVIRVSNQQIATKVYPNPTTGVLHLQGIQDNTVVRIYNTLGAYVGNVVVANETINISSLENGSYVLFINNDQKVQIMKH